MKECFTELDNRGNSDAEELSCALNLNYIQGSIISLITRYKDFRDKDDLFKISYFAARGKELSPDNNYSYSREKYYELRRYAEGNDFTSTERGIIYDAISQDWDKIELVCNNLIFSSHAD